MIEFISIPIFLHQNQWSLALGQIPDGIEVERVVNSKCSFLPVINGIKIQIFCIQCDNVLHTVFENHRKSLIKHCASEASYIFILSGQKLIKRPNIVNFERIQACGQTVLPDMSILTEQKLAKSTKIKKSNKTFEIYLSGNTV